MKAGHLSVSGLNFGSFCTSEKDFGIDGLLFLFQMVIACLLIGIQICSQTET